jgi:hypothetical protein
VSPRTRPASPEDTARIAAVAAQLPCHSCGAAPGAPCNEPGPGRSVCKSRWGGAAIEVSRQTRATRRTPEQEAILASLPRVSREEIEACRTPAGGYSFTRERLASWSVPWPPPPGWRQALERGEDSHVTRTKPQEA